MAVLPYIEMPESTSELLDVLGSKTELGKKLKLLNETASKVNAMLKRYNDYQSPEILHRNALQLAERAKVQKQEADDYLVAKRQEADSLYGIAEKRIEKREAELLVIQHELEATDAKLRTKDGAVALREKEARDLHELALSIKAQAEAKLVSAEAAEREFKGKLHSIEAVVHS